MKSPKFFSRRALAVATATCFAAVGFTAVTTALTTGTAVAASNTYHLTDTDNASGVFKQGGTPSITLTASLLTGTAETMQPTVTDLFPAGLVPTAPTGTTPWNCAASTGQNVSCLYTSSNLSPPSSYPPIVVAINVLASATPGAAVDAAAVSSADATTPVLANDSFTVELVPASPTITSVTGGGLEARVVFSSPTNNSGSAITGYVITPYIGGSAQAVQTFNTTATTEIVTGLISGDTYTFEVAAINGVGNSLNSAASGTATVDAAPSVTITSLPYGEVGTPFIQTLTGTAGTTPYSWTETGALPSGFTLTTGGVLAGTTTATGTFPMTVTLTDNLGETATKSLPVNILSGPVVTPTTVHPGEAGVAYSQTLAATGGIGAYTWSYTGTLPTGITLNSSTGVLGGNTSSVGYYPFTAIATDSNSQPGSEALGITVVADPTVTTATLPGGNLTVAYSQTLTGSGGTLPYTWTETGALPTGLSLSSAGVLSGTPVVTGSFPITVILTDSLARTASMGLTVIIGAAPVATLPVTTTVPVTVPSTVPVPAPAPYPIAPTTTVPVAVSVATGGSTAETPGGLGYWSLTPGGQLSEHGNAGNFGSENDLPHNSPIVGITSTSDGEGYWLVSANGGVFTFGDATFHGSLGAKHINTPIVGIIGTPDNGGYLLVSKDGGVFAFGDASFQGSLGNKHLNQPIVGVVPSPNGMGYMLLGSDGGVFAFGDTSFEGALGAGANKHIVAMALSPNGKGYWLVGTGGTVYTFGNATSFGSVAAKSGDKVVGIIANADAGYRLILASGKSIAFGTVPGN
jgi:hypothetical protein